MPFTPPSWVPELPYDIPDTLSAEDFIFNEHYRSRPLRESKAPFVDGLSGRSYNVHEARQRIDYLSRELSSRLQWHPNTGSPLDKVVAIYTLDSVSAIVAGLHEKPMKVGRLSSELFIELTLIYHSFRLIQ